MDPSQMASMNVQAQIRRNAEEQGNFLKSLGDWEKSIKVKDAEMKKVRVTKVREAKKRGATAPLGGVRESGGTIKIRQATEDDFAVSSEVQSTLDSKKRKEDERGVFLGTGMSDEPTPASIIAPAHLINVGVSVPKPKPRRSTEDLETEERSRGNECFKVGDYEGAVKSYTRCLGINSRSGVAFSNRSMAYLKLKEFLHAEKDASSAIDIDPTHVKSYQRRSSARVSLGKLRAALKDLKTAELLSGGGSGLAVEIRKCTEALRDSVKRAPKSRVRIVVASGVSRGAKDLDAVTEAQEEEEEEEEVLEIGDDGFDLSEVSKKTPAAVVSPPPAAASSVTGGKVKKHKAPKTAYDFEKTWRSIKGRAEKEKYLTESAAGLLSKLFSSGFQDATVFEQVVETLDGVCAVGAKNRSKVVGVVEDLANVKNVDMLCMMADKALISGIVKKAYGDGAVPEKVTKNLM
jgi:tetratricopeptide (TPR) repeat protein